MKLLNCPVSAQEAVRLIVDHPGHELCFARQKTGGRVHVLRPWVNEGMGDDPDGLRTSGLFIPAGIFGWSLCGQRINLSPDVRGYRTNHFRDEDLCWQCHKLLNDVSDEQGARCFEQDRPEEI